MKDKTTWDWQTREKSIPINEWQERFNWVQEPCVSPDGENIAAVVNVDDAQFSVCMNGEIWPETFEKAWSLQFGPDGRLAVLAANDEEWTVCVDGEFWETWFDYIWDLKFTPDGAFIGAAIQTGMEYGMAVNGQAWDRLYQNISGTVLSAQGDAAAVVQVDPMAQADISTFAAGIFSVAVNGEVQSDKFMNIEDICFDALGKKTAFAVRKSRLEYSLADNSGCWSDSFQFSWGPRFINNSNSIIAPVRQGGKWHLFKDGSDLWNTPFEQLWKLAVHEPTNKIAAVVSEGFGKWGIRENNYRLNFQCDTMVSDLFYSEDGDLLIAVFKDKGFWDIAVGGVSWGLKADKLWPPVISRNNTVLATRMEKDGQYFLVVNGRIYKENFDMLFEPAISPDSDKILFKALKGGLYLRQILPLDEMV